MVSHDHDGSNNCDQHSREGGTCEYIIKKIVTVKMELLEMHAYIIKKELTGSEFAIKLLCRTVCGISIIIYT